jgi:hypothetical protein
MIGITAPLRLPFRPLPGAEQGVGLRDQVGRLPAYYREGRFHGEALVTQRY